MNIKTSKELYRFLVIGVANFLITASIFWLALNKLSLSYHLALLLAWLIGNIFSYAYNYFWVFNVSNKIVFMKRLPYHFMVAIFSLTFNMLFLAFLVECLTISSFQGQLLLIPFIVTINFSLNKYWVYRLISKPEY